jgi:hypothetical protein
MLVVVASFDRAEFGRGPLHEPNANDATARPVTLSMPLT